MARTFYHGSDNASLRIAQDGKRRGTLFPFKALFFADSYSKAAVYGPHVYAVDVDEAKLFHAPPATGGRELHRYFTAFDTEYRYWGLRTEPEEASTFIAELGLWNEALDEEDLPFLGFVFNCSPWLAPARMNRFRLGLARRLGYIGATFNDGCGTIAVLEEFLPAQPRRAERGD